MGAEGLSHLFGNANIPFGGVLSGTMGMPGVA